jgi:hypothetical protein
VLKGAVEDGQETIVKRILDAGETSLVEWTAVTFDAVIADLTATRTSSRLTAEGIVAWAKVALASAMDARAKQVSDEKQHTDEQRKQQRAGIENAYCRELAKLSAPVPKIGQETAITLVHFLKNSGSNDDISAALLKKLDAMLNPEVASYL